MKKLNLIKIKEIDWGHSASRNWRPDLIPGEFSKPMPSPLHDAKLVTSHYLTPQIFNKSASHQLSAGIWEKKNKVGMTLWTLLHPPQALKGRIPWATLIKKMFYRTLGLLRSLINEIVASGVSESYVLKNKEMLCIKGGHREVIRWRRC